MLAVQTILDRQNFSCGCLDGVVGQRTRLAIRAWQEDRGLPATGELDDDLRAAAENTDDVFREYTVTEDDVSGAREVPTTWKGKAAADRLGYETVLEAVAEKHHATQRAVQRLNPGLSWPNPLPGTTARVPNPRPSPRVRAARLAINLAEKTVRAYDAEGRLVAMFPCSIAARAEKRPTGELSVINAARNPTYTFDPALFSDEPEAPTIGRRLIIPAGPNNPVGVAWIGLSLPGYGIHGTPKPEDIGKTESHGCFRLTNWNAEKLLNMVTIGMPVTIESGD